MQRFLSSLFLVIIMSIFIPSARTYDRDKPCLNRQRRATRFHYSQELIRYDTLVLFNHAGRLAKLLALSFESLSNYTRKTRLSDYIVQKVLEKDTLPRLEPQSNPVSLVVSLERQLERFRLDFDFVRREQGVLASRYLTVAQDLIQRLACASHGLYFLLTGRRTMPLIPVTRINYHLARLEVIANTRQFVLSRRAASLSRDFSKALLSFHLNLPKGPFRPYVLSTTTTQPTTVRTTTTTQSRP